jgi:hypothetical protein
LRGDFEPILKMHLTYIGYWLSPLARKRLVLFAG